MIDTKIGTGARRSGVYKAKKPTTRRGIKREKTKKINNNQTSFGVSHLLGVKRRRP